VRGRQRKIRDLVRLAPREILRALAPSRERSAGIGVECDAKARDGVSEACALLADLDVGEPVLERGAPCRALGRFSRSDLGVRQHPEPGEARRVRRETAEQELARSLDEGGDGAHRSHRAPLRELRQARDQALLRRDAALRDRAALALGRSRRADYGAKLHECLIEITRCLFRHELTRELPEPLFQRASSRVPGEPEVAAKHAHDVAVHERFALPERDAEDRARRVVTDARERAQEVALVRDFPRVTFHDLSRRRLQASSARVVAEPLPGGEHGVLGRSGERLERREALHPALVVRDRRRDLRLLQHDLAHPDRVRVPGSAKGEVTAVFPVPGDQARSKSLLLAGHSGSPMGRRSRKGPLASPKGSGRSRGGPS
jgi:hypothetical protein